MSPTIDQLAKGRPNAKVQNLFEPETGHISTVWASRVGKWNVSNGGGKVYHDSRNEALAAAQRFHADVLDAIAKRDLAALQGEAP